MGSEREQFEDWAKSEGLNTSKFITKGEYIHEETQSSWKAWQACKAEAVPDGYVVIKKSELADIHDMALDGKYLRETDQSQEKFTEIHEAVKLLMIESQEKENGC